MSGEVRSCSVCLIDFMENTQFILKDKLAFDGENSLDSTNMLSIRTKCNHVFHEMCLARWINEFKTKTSVPSCPECRTALMENAAVINPHQGHMPGLESDMPSLDVIQRIMFPLVVGGFSQDGLHVNLDIDYDSLGVSSVRRF